MDAGELELALQEFTERELDVLRKRTFAEKPMTLDRVAVDHAITRERVRQIESDALRRLANTPVGWSEAVSTVEQLPWSVFSVASANELLRALSQPIPTVGTSVLRVVERVTGAYEIKDGWLVRPNVATATQLTKALVRSQDGRLWSEDQPDFVAPADRAHWLGYLGVTEFRGRAYGRRLGVLERAEILLTDLGAPLSSGEIAAGIEVPSPPRSLRSRLSEDPRIVRTGKDEWGLVTWRMPAFVSITDAIVQAIDDAGGSMRLSRLVQEITAAHSVAESSVRSYASSSPFELASGVVSIAKPRKPSWQKQPSATRRLYRRAQAWCYRIEVTSDHARGSGFPISAGLARAIGVEQGSTSRRESLFGEQVVSFTRRQPTLGSVRRFLGPRRLVVGDSCFLVFRDDGAFDIEKVDGSGLEGTDLAARLAGIEDPGSISDLRARIAEAIGAPPSTSLTRLIELMRERGEYDLADLLVVA